jgi:hypothetical protein
MASAGMTLSWLVVESLGETAASMLGKWLTVELLVRV